jgi:hypothetical protein
VPFIQQKTIDMPLAVLVVQKNSNNEMEPGTSTNKVFNLKIQDDTESSSENKEETKSNSLKREEDKFVSDKKDEVETDENESSFDRDETQSSSEKK